MNKTAMVFAGLGFELFAVVVAGIAFGPAVDKYMGWNGLGFVVVGGLMFVGWVAHFIYLINRYMNDEMKSGSVDKSNESRDN